MKKIIYLVMLVFSVTGFAQTNRQIIKTYLEENRTQLKLTAADISDWIIETEVLGSGTKITSCHIVQRYQGIEIFNAQSNASLKDGKVLRFDNRFVTDISRKTNATTPSLTVIDAISKAYLLLSIPNSSAFAISETIDKNTFKLTDGLQEDLISAKLVYQIHELNTLKLSWAFQFYSPDGKHLWDLRIDALNGTILEKNDLNLNCSFGEVNHKNLDYTKSFSFTKAAFENKTTSPIQVNASGSYRVIPYNYESPNHSPFELITTGGNTLASPNGWHDVNTAIGGTNNALKFTFSRGNNVLAQEDANGDNGNGIRADGTAALNFDFSYGGQSLQPTAYTSAATTNLFYMINTIHDIWYQYGFNEAGGNFQQNNYGRGGATTATGDYVFADAQDGYSQAVATLNNANFSTPNDGSRPRVQMFLWDAGAPPTDFITVNAPANIAGAKVATTNVFEGTDRVPVPAAPNGITSDLALYASTPLAPLQNPNSACGPATNPFDIAGKITLIRRGGCFFSNKVKAAQDAGATAVIVMDSIPNNPTRLSMSSTGILGITIPAVFITKELGDELMAEMANGPVNVKLEAPSGLYLFADGDFDNGIIGHEVGHGISNRLIGGPANSSCMTNGEQMGEGWSDWFGLILQIRPGDTGAEARGVGTYAINEPITGGGIRAFPYSTDFGINPLTLADSNDAESHNRGETWTAVLWDLTWAYINKYGFDPDIYNGTGGNNRVMRLVIDALKLQTCNTASFISARDNIFAADQATTGGLDYCMITKVFERRGMGLNASSGDVNSGTDQVEDFTPFLSAADCLLAVDYFSNEDMIRVYPNPTNGMLNIRINQYSGNLSIQIIDINGRQVYNQTDQNFNIEKSINLSALQKGMYVLKLTNSNINYTEKIIIK